MNNRELLRARLYLQNLERPLFKTPADMVKYFGAVQAQDFLGSLWAVGQRTENSTEASVEAALINKSIIRSWPMRGTLHFVCPEDIRWMLDLLAPRVFAKAAGVHRDAGLTTRDFVKARKVLEKALQGNKQLDRDDLYACLMKGGIDPANSRGLHILGQLAREKVICFGPRKGKQQTFVLLDEWVPGKNNFSKDESLAELATRYFSSHGPASIRDLSWWAGLTLTEAARALELVKQKLQKIKVGDLDLWMGEREIKSDNKLNVRLLPAYDEFLVSYSDRSASETAAISKLKDINTIFTSTIIVNGHVAGLWKRTIAGKKVDVKINLFEKVGKGADAGIKREVKRYTKFVGVGL